MSPEERVQEIRRIGTEYALLAAKALLIAQRINAIHAENPASPIIVDLLWQIREIKASQVLLDLQLARLGARRVFVDVVPSAMPESIPFDETKIQEGRSSRRKRR